MFAAAAVAAALSLLAAAAAERFLAAGPVELGPLGLRLSFNPGIAFSLGDRFPGPVRLLTVVLVALLTLFAWRLAPAAGRVAGLAGGAALGGAVANVLDRIPDGQVTDYLSVGWWPTFNLSDSFIMVGAATLVLWGRAGSAQPAETPPPSPSCGVSGPLPVPVRSAGPRARRPGRRAAGRATPAGR